MTNVEGFWPGKTPKATSCGQVCRHTRLLESSSAPEAQQNWLQEHLINDKATTYIAFQKPSL